MFRKFTSERVRRARRRRLVILSVIYAMLVISVFLVVWQASYLSWMRIDSVVVSGTKALSHSDVFARVVPHLSGAYGGVFSKRNILLYPQHAITEDIATTFPRIDTVRVSRVGPHTIVVEVSERIPAALVCRRGGETECYLLDANGFIFSDAPRFSGNTYVVYSARLVEEPVGRRFLSSRGFAELHAFVQSLTGLALYAHAVAVYDNFYEMTVRVQGTDTHIIVSASMPYEETFRNLEAILSEEDFSIGGVERIDLRFGNKVFFREKAGTATDGFSESPL